MPTQFESKGIFEIVYDGFRMYLIHFVPFFILGAGLSILVRVLQWIAEVPSLDSAGELSDIVRPPYVYALPFAMLAGLVVYPISSAAVTIATARMQLGATTPVVDVFLHVVARLKPVLLANLYLTGMLALAVGGPATAVYWTHDSGGIGAAAALLLMVTGIVLAAVFVFRYAFLTQAVVVDGTDAQGAFARSRDLMVGQKGRLLILLILQQVASALPAAVLPSSRAVVAEGILFIITPVFLIAGALFYLDVRVRKEGLGPDTLMSQFNQGPANEHS